MNKPKAHNRIISAMLAAVITVTSCFVPQTFAFAADYNIQFFDTTSKKTSVNTQIVEGTSINIRANLPPNYTISTMTPFAVHKSNSPDDASGNFDITNNTDKSYTLTANAGAAGAFAQDYTLEAIYTAMVFSGTGSGAGSYVDESGQTVVNDYVLDVKTDVAGLAMTEDSSFTFVASGDESAEGIFGIETITTATGAFTNYVGSKPNAANIISEGGKRSFRLTATSNSALNPKPLDLTVYITGPTPVRKGTIFKIDFRRQTINSLIVAVITEQKLVDDTVSSVVKNPTFPEATDAGVPYIKLENGETLDSIRSSFEVLSKFHRWNVDVKLEWEWDADKAEYQDYVKLQAGTLGKSVFDILQRPLEDMTGKLLVKADYNGTKSVVGEIPIIIYGSGTPATITPVSQTTGVPGTPPTQKVENISALPSKMDVYDGTADFASYPDSPQGPYLFNGSLTFGTGRGMSSYAIITNESSGGEFKIHIDGDANEYKLGDKIENIGKSKSIELTATKEGQCNLVVQFFNSNGDEMAKNLIRHQLRIYDKSPSRDARLQALDLKLVAGDSIDQSFINNIYKSGLMDFGFDKDVNVYNITVPYKSGSISLRPRIPADTEAKKIIKLIYDGVEVDVNTGDFSGEIALNPLVPKKIIVQATSQGGTQNEYTLNITRDEQSKDSLLSMLQVLRTDGVAGDLIQGFKPDVLEYNIDVPYRVSEVQLKTYAQSPWAKDISYDPAPKMFRILWWEWPTNKFDLPCDYDPATDEVSNNVTTIKVTVTAEDGVSQTTYTVNITRLPPSSDNTLSALTVTDEMGMPYVFKDNQKFDPKVRQYFVEIPYTVQNVEIAAQHTSEVAKKMTLKEPKTYGSGEKTVSIKAGALTTFRNVVTTQDKAKPLEERNLFSYELYVEAENGSSTTPPYIITFVRKIASDDNLLSSLKIFDENNKELKFNENQSFTPEIREYYLTIPYTAKTINIEAVHRGPTAQQISLTEPVVYGGKTTDVALKDNDMRATRFASLDVSQNMQTPTKDKNAFDYTLTVTAENAFKTKPTYVIHVVRSDPDADTRLASLDVTDQDKKPVETFAFNQEQLEYTIPVPYAVTRVTLTPKATAKGAVVIADDVQITPTRQSITVELISGKERVINISVKSESNEIRVYTLKFTRQAPDAEARLSALAVDALPLTPKFNPSTLKYEITVPEGTKGYTVTPTAYSQFATITVNGKPVKSGEKSGTIRPIDPKTSVNIEVTAQDGTTKVVYVLNVTDENLIERSNNADLRSISISNASLTPYFKSAIETYDVAIAPETYSVDIKPKLADENAQVKVMDGSRELESYNGVYSTGIREDETTISVEVTSQDKSKTKKYSFTVYKDDEEKQGVYKPITADMINWEQSPIIVDISKYSVVSAEVFNTLKTEYPDKQMIFEGNDYSLTINGKDIATLVPNTELFDFTLTYNGPNNDTIKALINALDARNSTLVPVIAHFGYHGALPGPMQLQISLGGFYKNARLYWNYHNAERNRIDYYGYFRTNAQGTFSVPLTHMSDYVITTAIIYGSENKVGFAGGGENIGGAVASKPNPSTKGD